MGNFQSVEVEEELTVSSSQLKDCDLCCSVQLVDAVLLCFQCLDKPTNKQTNLCVPTVVHDHQVAMQPPVWSPIEAYDGISPSSLECMCDRDLTERLVRQDREERLEYQAHPGRLALKVHLVCLVSRENL